MSVFKPGDVVIYIAAKNKALIGQEATVLSTGWRLVNKDGTAYREDGIETTLSVPGPGGTCTVPENLRLKRPPGWNSWLFDTRDVEREQREPAHARDGVV